MSNDLPKESQKKPIPSLENIETVFERALCEGGASELSRISAEVKFAFSGREEWMEKITKRVEALRLEYPGGIKTRPSKRVLCSPNGKSLNLYDKNNGAYITSFVLAFDMGLLMIREHKNPITKLTWGSAQN